MALETTNAKLAKNIVRCDKCAAFRSHSTQVGYETAPGVIEWREEINGCQKHPVVAVVHKLDGTVVDWKP